MGAGIFALIGLLSTFLIRGSGVRLWYVGALLYLITAILAFVGAFAGGRKPEPAAEPAR